MTTVALPPPPDLGVGAGVSAEWQSPPLLPPQGRWGKELLLSSNGRSPPLMPSPVTQSFSMPEAYFSLPPPLYLITVVCVAHCGPATRLSRSQPGAWSGTD